MANDLRFITRTSALLAFGRQFGGIRESRPSQKCGGCGAEAWVWEDLAEFCSCSLPHVSDDSIFPLDMCGGML